jgi:hypothetical protein
MEEKTRMESAIQNLRDYMETRWNLFILNTSDKASGLVSSIASILLIAISMLFVLLFLSIGAALWIGQAYGQTSMGFLFIGLFYLVVSIILYASRHTLIKMPVVNKIVNTLYADDKD